MQPRYYRNYVYNHIPTIHPVIFYDDCEGTEDYDASGDGADYVVLYTTTHMLTGDHALYLATKATAPAADDEVQAAKYLWLPPYKRLEFDTCFAMFANVSCYVHVYLYWYDGTNAHAAAIRLTSATEAAAYMNSGATWTTLTGFTWNNDSTPKWNHLHFILDLDAEEYLSIDLNHHHQDMTDTAYPTSADASTPYLMLALYLQTRANSQAKFVFDHILLRGDNP